MKMSGSKEKCSALGEKLIIKKISLNTLIVSFTPERIPAISNASLYYSYDAALDALDFTR